MQINSLKEAGQKLLDDVWRPYMKIYKQEGDFESMKFAERGMYIAKAERDKLKDLVVEIVRSIIVPYAEKRYKMLSINSKPKNRFTFFSKEGASALPVDNKVRILYIFVHYAL